MQSALIVEDVSETAVWLQEMLQQALAEVSVDVCTTWHAAREKIESGARVNLVLLDINLPDGNGLDLVRTVLKYSPDAYVIISTIFDDEDHILTALQYGAKGYLLKDSPEQVFIQKLRGILTGDPPLSPGIARKILRHFNRSLSPENGKRQNVQAAPAAAAQMPAIPLSPRENEVLVLVAKGLSRKEVARMLGLSVNTVARYIRDVYQKLDISSQAEAAVEACRMGLVGLET